MAKIFLLFMVMLLFVPIVLAAQEVEVDFFYSTTCPHCKAEKAFLESLDKECDYVKINYYISSENEELWREKAEPHGIKIGSVPQTFIGEKAFIGFTNDDGPLEFNEVYNAYIGYGNQIQNAIDEIQTHTEHDPNQCAYIDDNKITKLPRINFWQYLIFIVLFVYGLSFFYFRKKFQKRQWKKHWLSVLVLLILITIFIFIKTFSEVSITQFASGLPFPLFVFIIALADGFNPCAFTVLIILLSLLTYTKKKGDMLLIGLTFIVTSAVMYFIFIMVMIFIGSWAMESYSNIISLVLGIGILIAGLINMKDFFFFKKGVSLSISDKDKTKFTKKARDIINKLKDANDLKTIIMAVLGTIVLGIFVNLVELGCTAILPAIYMTSLIGSYGTSMTVSHLWWTAFYSIVYIIPLLAILLNFIYYFKSTRLSEGQGRKLKLFSGIMMIVFGLIMIFSPGLLVFG